MDDSDEESVKAVEDMTIDELLRMAGERLLTAGDRTLVLAHAVEKNTEALLSVKRGNAEREEAADQRERGWTFTLEKLGEAQVKAIKEIGAEQTRALNSLNEALGKLSKGVDDAEDAADKAAKAAQDAKDTGVQQLQRKERSPAAELAATFRELPTGLKALIIILGALIGAHTEIAKFLESLAGG